MMTQQEVVDFWAKSSDMDFNDMESMFKSKRYHWALFVGHLVIEKLLKALFVKNHGKETKMPFIHNLLLLANKADLIISEKQKKQLSVFTEFNINARYQDYKFKFYKKCTKQYTAKHIKEIKEVRKWLKNQIYPKPQE
ncbi:MAG: HEPN domain-containing protein [Elusimicrobiota bacterium]|jgi:HEPN domain-containing protein|nr:HEPN domain-containing protein [Elusimicrobiota bacterium]